MVSSHTFMSGMNYGQFEVVQTVSSGGGVLSGHLLRRPPRQNWIFSRDLLGLANPLFQLVSVSIVSSLKIVTCMWLYYEFPCLKGNRRRVSRPSIGQPALMLALPAVRGVEEARRHVSRPINELDLPVMRRWGWPRARRRRQRPPAPYRIFSMGQAVTLTPHKLLGVMHSL